MNPTVADSIERIVDKHIGATAPAIQLTVIEKGSVLANCSRGVVGDGGAIARQDTLFDLASLTKLFTATAFLCLASRGIVEVDQSVTSVITAFGEMNPRPIGPAQDPHTERPLPVPNHLLGKTVDPTAATFRHLLTHTAGLAPWKNLFRLGEPRWRPPPAAWPEMRQAIVSGPFTDTIGAGIHYSDLGFMLLGEAVARLQSTSLDQAVADLVTGPLGLDTIQFNPLGSGVDREAIAPTELDSRWRASRCHGHVHDENAFAAGGIAGHAGLFGTATDVARFGMAWLDPHSDRLLSRELKTEALSEQFTNRGERRGLGWMLRSNEDEFWGRGFSNSSFGHTGFTGTSLWIDPPTETVVACLTNRVYHGRNPGAIKTFRLELHETIARCLTTPER